MKPKAVLFDLCDTLFLFDPQRLPSVYVNSQEIRSTTGLVHETLCKHAPIPFEPFYNIFVEITQEIIRVREQDHREVTSLERFQRVLHRLELGPIQIPASVLMQIVLTHMNALATALHLPHSHRIVIEAIRNKYLLGIITNFDHAPTVHQLLFREGLKDYFEPVVISAEVGWRKPRREIFQKALDLLGLKAEETVFVGNDLKIDVVGAQAMGIPTIWFNRHSEIPIPQLPLPDHSLSHLEDLQKIL
jgi:putative hydrolase of the HAD superfamily